MSDTHLQVDKTRKRKPRRQPPPLAVMGSVEEMQTISITGKVDSTPTTWENLPPYSIFSGSPDGSFPMIKVTKRQYADMRTGKSTECGSGRCYRIFF
ncbi:hypothetical protein [Tolypothrix sp. PCC 7601]|uniref:hypothetical protein n=1 Tax=Tolypothrix sp. PCC 7601 TaxID=1188 RepID=UPI0021E073BF|nr:hypothetical protein [Tolypothrix sp. PCC 7601]UYD38961.1 hypothetical protein HG267_41475 [Tolypothrix sp. PCC 7601]